MTIRQRMKSIMLAGIAWTIVSGTACAATYYVALTASEGDGSSGSPWRSITNAVAHVGAGDLIRVAGGVYTQNVTLATTNLTIQGGYNPTDWSWAPSNQITAIQSTGGNSPVTLSLATVTNTLRYLTLRGGSAANQAGILLTGNAALTILEGCTVTNNLYGVRIRAVGAGLVLRNDLIARNSSYGFFADLTSLWPGGGNFALQNCTVANNGSHGLIASYQVNSGYNNPVAMVTNTLFTGNNGYGMAYGSAGCADYCLFYGNPAGPWSWLTGSVGHNIVGKDPHYVNAASNNYQLLSNSPAVASGTNSTASGVTNDIVGAARPGPNGWDMGVYQGNGTGAPLVGVNAGYVSKLGSDLTGDGSRTNPWASVGFGLGQMSATGTLCVAGGVYTDNVIMCGAVNQTIRGGYDPATWAWSPALQRTAIFGNVYAPVKMLASTGTNALNCLTLYGGSGGNPGLDVSVYAPATMIADACTITGNTYGVSSGDYVVQMVLRNCLIARNSGNGVNAAAAYHDTGSTYVGFIQVYNCTIATNTGNGCYVSANGQWRSAVPLTAVNTLITGNTGSGIYIDANGTGGALARQSLFYGNLSGAWIATDTFNHTSQVLTDGGNNYTNQDPLYVSVAKNNFQLTGASPAFNTGTNLAAQGVTNDIIGVKRPMNGVYDRGAYEYVILGSVMFFR